MVVTLFHSQLTSFLRRCAREELKTSTEALLTYRHSESGKVRKERSSSRLGVALLERCCCSTQCWCHTLLTRDVDNSLVILIVGADWNLDIFSKSLLTKWCEQDGWDMRKKRRWLSYWSSRMHWPNDLMKRTMDICGFKISVARKSCLKNLTTTIFTVGIKTA